ncbi:MAG: rRNA methyltransferase [Thermoprotei archaeon]|nr:MAG: rRNA methyltransferase [Thermoprotei archaeon]
MMGIRVVLVEPEGEVNIGFIARLIENFNVDEFYIVNPKANIISARRFAARASHILDKAIIVNTLKDALSNIEFSGCTSAKVGSPGDYLRHSVSIEKFAELAMHYRNIALVFGRESVGLTRNELKCCDLVVYIPTSPKYPALNVSHAVAIALYELFKRKSLGELEKLEYATGLDLKIINRYIDELSRTILSDIRQREGASTAFKRAIRKAMLTRTEAGLITVLLRKTLIRVKQCEEKRAQRKST